MQSRLSIIVALALVVGRSSGADAQVDPACKSTSRAREIAAVQRSSEFRDAVHRIANVAYPNDPEAFAVEFQRICASLTLWRSKAFPGLQIVYAPAYRGFVVMPVYFGLDHRIPKVLNPTPPDSLKSGIDQSAWNSFVTRGVSPLDVGRLPDAAKLGCLIYSMWLNDPPSDACDRARPAVVKEPDGWRIQFDDTVLRLAHDGEIQSIAWR